MKNLTFKLLLTAFFVVVVSVSANAQADFSQPAFERYGKDVAEREKNYKAYSLFNEEYNAKNYAEASVYLKQLLTDIPSVHQNLYIRGAAMFKKLIATSKDKEQRAIYIDSLMILNDYRIQEFGDHPQRGKAYILTEKIKDNINFRANDHDVVTRAVDAIISEVGGEINPSIYPVYFQYLTQLYSNDAIETEYLLERYEKINEILDASSNPEKGDFKDVVEKLLMDTDAASCENLESIFKPQFEANPDDAVLIAKISRTLAKAECSSDFQLAVAEKYYAIEPSASAAASLAFGFDKKGDFEKAIQYYQEAIDKETDNTNKVSFALSAAGASLLKSEYSQAINFSRKAIAIDAESGLAYFFLAQAQAASLPNCGEFTKKAAFWIIVDNLNKARTLLSGDQQTQAAQLASSYTSYFPSAEDVFFNDLKAGDKFTVNCGSVSGTTTVRTR